MLIEASFALCAICLPSLSPAFNLDGVRSFFTNISNIFTLHSRTSAPNLVGQTYESGELLPSGLAKIESGSRTDPDSQPNNQISLPPLPYETKRNVIEMADGREYTHTK